MNEADSARNGGEHARLLTAPSGFAGCSLTGHQWCGAWKHVALIAQGYTLVFGVLDKLNFAHGEIFMLGGFVCLASIALGASLANALTFAVEWSD